MRWSPLLIIIIAGMTAEPFGGFENGGGEIAIGRASGLLRKSDNEFVRAGEGGAAVGLFHITAFVFAMVREADIHLDTSKYQSQSLNWRRSKIHKFIRLDSRLDFYFFSRHGITSAAILCLSKEH